MLWGAEKSSKPTEPRIKEHPSSRGQWPGLTAAACLPLPALVANALGRVAVAVSVSAAFRELVHVIAVCTASIEPGVARDVKHVHVPYSPIR